jgi:hypothetical protein
MLKRLILALALAGAPLATAQADTLTAGQTKTTALADWYANICCSVIEGTYQVVVITLAPGLQEGGRPMRVVHRLADGESQEISIGGFGKNTLLATLKVSRASDQVFARFSEPLNFRLFQQYRPEADVALSRAIVVPLGIDRGSRPVPTS